MRTMKCAAALLICIGLLTGGALAEGKIQITFLDVGQGDCALLQSGGEAMLIDAGPSEAWEHVRDMLEAKEVKALKYLVMTHPHADHIGTAANLVGSFAVKAVILPPIEAATRVYDAMITEMKKRNVSLIYPGVGDAFTLGDATCTVYGPHPVAYANANDWSVALMVRCNGFAALFMGDAEYAAEMDMLGYGHVLPLKADVLKVAHHGSDTSSSFDFLAEVSPDIAVVSCGDTAAYPNTDVAMALMDAGVTSLLTTKASGDIVVTFEDWVSVSTER